MAPKRAAKGLVASEEAAPVLSGGLPEEELVGLVVPEVRETERVGAETVEFVPAEGLMVAEAERTMLLMAAEAAEEAEARADEMAEERVPSPPVRGNWPE